MTLGPLHWECRVLTTAPPGNSQSAKIFITYLFLSSVTNPTLHLPPAASLSTDDLASQFVKKMETIRWELPHHFTINYLPPCSYFLPSVLSRPRGWVPVQAEPHTCSCGRHPVLSTQGRQSAPSPPFLPLPVLSQIGRAHV